MMGGGEAEIKAHYGHYSSHLVVMAKVKGFVTSSVVHLSELEEGTYGFLS